MITTIPTVLPTGVITPAHIATVIRSVALVTAITTLGLDINIAMVFKLMEHAATCHKPRRPNSLQN
jgi:hypothetical protein